MDIKDTKRKRAMLLHYAGPDVESTLVDTGGGAIKIMIERVTHSDIFHASDEYCLYNLQLSAE